MYTRTNVHTNRYPVAQTSPYVLLPTSIYSYILLYPTLYYIVFKICVETSAPEFLFVNKKYFRYFFCCCFQRRSLHTECQKKMYAMRLSVNVMYAARGLLSLFRTSSQFFFIPFGQVMFFCISTLGKW